jgi:hypothetical protein
MVNMNAFRGGLFVSALAIVTMISAANADASCTLSGDAFGRGYCAINRGHHGQWLRGSVNLRGASLVVRQGLESDSTVYGI